MHYSVFEKHAAEPKFAIICVDGSAQGMATLLDPGSRCFNRMKIWVTAVIMGLIGAVGTAFADESTPPPPPPHDVFTVHQVPVDVTARNAAIARTLAVRNGEKRAFSMLIERLVAPDHVDALESLDQERITDLVLGLQFANEKSSQVHYIADLTVRFNGEKIRKLLKETQTPFTQTMGTPLLVLPVLEYAGARQLWEKDNLWFKAWAAQDLINPLLPYILPEGTGRDQMTLSQFQATAHDPAQRHILASNYGVSGAFVPLATVVPDFRDGGYKVTVNWLYDDMTLETIAKGSGKQVFHSKPGESLADTLTRAAAGVIEVRDRIWKDRTLIRLDETRSLSARVPLRNMNDWAGVQRHLDQVNMIQSVTLQALSLHEAQIDISYAGRSDQLVLALSQNDLVLRRHGNDVYVIPGDLAAERNIKPDFDFTPPGEDGMAVVPPDAMQDTPAPEDVSVPR